MLCVECISFMAGRYQFVERMITENLRVDIIVLCHDKAGHPKHKRFTSGESKETRAHRDGDRVGSEDESAGRNTWKNKSGDGTSDFRRAHPAGPRLLTA
ncbi:uncharacterized protein LY79DRAFT_567357 [Colletotrichum navitas]|uniref:Uncharacterized protein n=1 Tax=Colletotrichum navitas TaxID=681940 RepID=A0AAD8PPB3_9PEZI|nr:uncharacterized protein LY79DRAFT_567357 [Colletotrichum navitas]KAK1573910.1 hypothetical protein LY79DRAFT_567357 [Colletotrichum navitas]